MQFIKCRSNELVVLGKLMDHNDLIEKILDGLDDNYKDLVDVIEGSDTFISFNELHKKLINRKLSLQQSHLTHFSTLVMANVAFGHHNRGSRSPFLSACLGA